MTKPIVIVGAGRHARAAADIFSLMDPSTVAGYLDDTRSVGEIVTGYPVLDGFKVMRDRAFVLDHTWHVGIGDNIHRRELYRVLADAGASLVSAIHQRAQVSRSATLGRGVYIGCFVNIGADAVICDWALVSGNTFVGVDGYVGEAAFVGAGSRILAGTSLGARSFLGAGTTLSNDASVGDDCVIGANSFVRGHLPNGTTAYGAPARPAPLKRQPFRR